MMNLTGMAGRLVGHVRGAHATRPRNATRTTRPRQAGQRLRIERLEDRLALAGLGPEDGATIIEPWEGSYAAVEIRSSDQAIFASAGTSNSTTIVRYDSLGNIDTSYGVGGLGSVPVLMSCSGALALQSDGKAVVGGRVAGAGGQVSISTGRLNAAGLPDSGFDSDGVSAPMEVAAGQIDEACAVGVQSNGKIVVAGQSGYTPGNLVVGRFNTNGAVDSGKGGFGQVVKGKATGFTVTKLGAGYYFNRYEDIAIQPDDRIVAVGELDDGDDTVIVARYTASGILDTSFNGTGFNVLLPAGFTVAKASAVSLQDDGKIVVVGTSTGTDPWNDMFIARFNADGTLDSSFGGGSGYVRLDVDDGQASSNERANGVAIQPDGKIVAGGYTATFGNRYSVLVARLNPDGSLDPSFGAGGIKLGNAPAGRSFVGKDIELQSDGSIIVAGYDEDTTGNDRHPLLMRFHGDNTPQEIPAETTATGASVMDAALMYFLAEESLTTRRKAAT